jgi:hypothetical protein
MAGTLAFAAVTIAASMHKKPPPRNRQAFDLLLSFHRPLALLPVRTSIEERRSRCSSNHFIGSAAAYRGSPVELPFGKKSTKRTYSQILCKLDARLLPCATGVGRDEEPLNPAAGHDVAPSWVKYKMNRNRRLAESSAWRGSREHSLPTRDSRRHRSPPTQPTRQRRFHRKRHAVKPSCSANQSTTPPRRRNGLRIKSGQARLTLAGNAQCDRECSCGSRLANSKNPAHASPFIQGQRFMRWPRTG